MRLLRLILVSVLALAGVLVASPLNIAAADDDCSTLAGSFSVDGTGVFSTPSLSLEMGDMVGVQLSGAGDTFDFYVNGVLEASNVAFADTSVVYEVPADGSYVFRVEVTGAFDATTVIVFPCSDVDDEDDEDDNDGEVTLCHIPPGNPAAAHTITVGAPALDAHLGHGDFQGTCGGSNEVNLGVGVTVFISVSGDFEVWGDCDDDDCDPLAVVDVDELEPTSEGGIVIRSRPVDGWYIIVYFLGDSHLNINVNVFQINVYVNGNLADDSTLILVDEVTGVVATARN